MRPQVRRPPAALATPPIAAGGASDASLEAITRVEAMELARLAAEARARADEEEWSEEEQRLQEEEAWRREARAAREEEDEERREAERLRLEERVELNDDHHPDGDDDGEETSMLLPPSTSVYAELLEIEGNARCFDCDAGLSAATELDDETQDGNGGTTCRLWWSATHGTLLCASCARVHQTLATTVSRVRPADADEAELSTMSPELDVLYAGGNRAFAAFLSEEAIGVPRHVWLALPLTTRYHTPAADLYRRRLCALVEGASTLPTDLHRVLPPRAGGMQEAWLDQEGSQEPPPTVGQRQGPPIDPWVDPPLLPPFYQQRYASSTDAASMADMRRRIEAANKAASAGR